MDRRVKKFVNGNDSMHSVTVRKRRIPVSFFYRVLLSLVYNLNRLCIIHLLALSFVINRSQIERDQCSVCLDCNVYFQILDRFGDQIGLNGKALGDGETKN